MLSLSSTNQPQPHGIDPRGFLASLGIVLTPVQPSFLQFQAVTPEPTLPAFWT